jgi:XrtJ-associated TM-motif-TM protein
MKKYSLFLAAVLFLAVCAPLHAQGGCVDSPENPTAILAVVGSAGAFLVAARSRFRRK